MPFCALQEYYLKALSTPRQDGTKFVDMLGPEGGEEHFERRRSLDRRASAIGKTAPGRLVSKLVALWCNPNRRHLRMWQPHFCGRL